MIDRRTILVSVCVLCVGQLAVLCFLTWKSILPIYSGPEAPAFSRIVFFRLLYSLLIRCSFLPGSFLNFSIIRILFAFRPIHVFKSFSAPEDKSP